MFNKKDFANVLQKISTTYSSISEFAEKSEVNRTYLSKYINMKLDNPPTPKILEKISDASNGITTYKDLMLICNYIDDGLDTIAGESIELFSNPYIDKSKCTSAEEYIYNIIYTYSILDTSNYTNSQKEKIIESYNYIKNDKDYSKYIFKNDNFKKQYYQNYIRDKSVITKSDLKDKLFLIPIVGKVAAGKPIFANENIEGYLPIDPLMYNLTSPNGFFFLQIQGESMNKLIKNGSFALIKKQDYAENGDVIVAIVNGDDEATIKRYKQLNEQFIMLEPVSEDSSFQAITIDLKNTNFSIIGKVIGDFKRWS